MVSYNLFKKPPVVDKDCAEKQVLPTTTFLKTEVLEYAKIVVMPTPYPVSKSKEWQVSGNKRPVLWVKNRVTLALIQQEIFRAHQYTNDE
jgi:hypothetical protein